MKRNEVESLAKKFEAKLKKIKVCAFDIDGILTDGKIYWQGDDLGWNRSGCGSYFREKSRRNRSCIDGIQSTGTIVCAGRRGACSYHS